MPQSQKYRIEERRSGGSFNRLKNVITQKRKKKKKRRPKKRKISHWKRRLTWLPQFLRQEKNNKNLPTQKYEFIFTFVFLPPPLIKQLTLPALLKPSKQHRTHP